MGSRDRTTAGLATSGSDVSLHERTGGEVDGTSEQTNERTDGLGLGHAGVRVLGQLDGRKADKDEQEATVSKLLDDCDE
ncbi:hypothetical protein PPTG_19082 [Phytophthora nicotianae INRA-310]|uniref:Uncharacterized protein n=1 Tax=Phytophthora nicotianae (strain INRA-310) TaxID=761204 RepID=W2PEM7_PHYN3|nr:hypothetical protein PPTG_19082 [Phytophthora nicotianae INRA-310]ETM99110.1 hypothetical protein PPTG_19082 [Phytophthora nicotianae INRA-310]